MILLPELETVVLLVPRTGTGSLWRALSARYPKAMMPYRHMEADGVPFGYDQWRRVGVVRDPVDRLWSLFNYMRERSAVGSEYRNVGEEDRLWLELRRQSVARPFDDWLLNNELLFSKPYRDSGFGYMPAYATHHPIPENRKSQWLYLRPDLGTTVYRYADQLPKLFEDLDVLPVATVNATWAGGAPPLSPEASRHVERFFSWDLAATR